MAACSTCGYEVVPKDHYCTNCGAHQDSADAGVIPETGSRSVAAAAFGGQPSAANTRESPAGAAAAPRAGQFASAQTAAPAGPDAAWAAPPPASAAGVAGGSLAPAGFAAPQPVAACPNCGQGWTGSQSCAFCGQVWGLPNGIVLASAGRRLGGYLLDGLLVLCTLVIGWVIWSLVVWAQGQTPGKQMLGMRVVRLDQRTYAGWGRMFLREFVGKLIVWLIASFIFGIGAVIADLWLLWDKDKQELWDKIAGTVVVADPDKRLVPSSEVV